MKLHRLRWILYAWLVLTLIGCGGVGKQEDITGILELTPLPTSFVNADCTNPSELENWLQTLVFNQAEFVDFLQNAQGQSRAQLFRQVQNLNTVALTVASTPILSCGQIAYQLTIQAMQTTLNNMRVYVNGERQDLDAIIAMAQAQFAESQNEHNALITLLDELYQNNILVP